MVIEEKMDTLGLLIGVYVCGGNVSEKAGAKKLLSGLKHQKPSLSLCGRVCSDDVKGFVVIPKRWVVERTFSWLNQSRRLAKDYEKTTLSAESFIHIAMVRIMLNRL
jgi:transposase